MLDRIIASWYNVSEEISKNIYQGGEGFYPWSENAYIASGCRMSDVYGAFAHRSVVRSLNYIMKLFKQSLPMCD